MMLAWESAPHSVWAAVGTGVISVYPFSEVDGLMPGTTACMDLSLQHWTRHGSDESLRCWAPCTALLCKVCTRMGS